MKLPFIQKRIELSISQKKRIVARANQRTRFLPRDWRTKAFHGEVIRLTERKKARFALRGAKIVSISSRKQVFVTVSEYAQRRVELGEKYHGLKFKNELTYAKSLFEKQIHEIVGKKATKFLNIFFSVHG